MTAVEDPAKPDAGLYLVGTPIGNLGDITVRALEVLRSADLILAEDTRITRRLLDRYDIHAPMWSYHKFNEAGRIDPVLDRLRAIGFVEHLGEQFVHLTTHDAMRAIGVVVE